MSIGNLVKKRRKYLNMTQQELAKGICTQALISKIERDELNPSADIMLKVSERLEVSLSFFYGQNFSNEDKSDIKKLEQLIRKHLSLRNYHEIKDLIDSKEIMKEDLSGREEKFFQWISGLLNYYIEHDFDNSLSILKNITLSNKDDGLSTEILMSISSIYIEEEKYTEALDVFKNILLYCNTANDYKLKIKMLFNYSLCLKKLNMYDEAILKVTEGIEVCILNNSMYLLGDLLYQKVLLLLYFKDNEAAKTAAEEAVLIFGLQKNESYRIKAKILLSELI